MEDVKLIPKRRSYKKRILVAFIGLLVLWGLLAYLLVPALWERYAHRHPSFDDVPGITLAGDGVPGDPLNVALIGTKIDLMKIMVAAKWYPSDPLSFKSCLEIAEATVLKRPYDAAPVSNLYLFGRKEDLAFEQPVGDNPRVTLFTMHHRGLRCVISIAHETFCKCNGNLCTMYQRYER